MDFDQVRLAFFAVPGLVENIVNSPHPEIPPEIDAELAKCQCIAGEMLAFPYFVDGLMQTLEARGWSEEKQAAFETLARLVRNDPVGALAFPDMLPVIIRALQDADDYGEPSTRPQHDPAVIKLLAEEEALVTFWRNVPRLWAVLSVARMKQRSPLRRLPQEMFRLLGDMMLCGREENEY